jgi:hypothetical protein
MRSSAAVAAILLLAACAPAPTTADATAAKPSAAALPAIDATVWRDVGAGRLSATLALMCVGGLDDLGRADTSLHDKTALEVPWSIQVTRKGKMQAQCLWSGPNGRTGRVVMDVLCKNEDDDRCSRFAYGLEGARRLLAVAHLPRRPPPISTTFPPGRDAMEHARSEAILSWSRDHAADQIGALREEFHGARVGIDADAKTPVLCGQVREAGGTWHRFAVYSLGGVDLPTYHWLREPHDKAVADFCNAKGEDFQWYAVSDAKMAG